MKRIQKIVALVITLTIVGSLVLAGDRPTGTMTKTGGSSTEVGTGRLFRKPKLQSLKLEEILCTEDLGPDYRFVCLEEARRHAGRQTGYFGLYEGETQITFSLVDHARGSATASAAMQQACKMLRKQGYELKPIEDLGNEAYWFRCNGCLHMGVRRGRYTFAFTQGDLQTPESIIPLAELVVARLP